MAWFTKFTKFLPRFLRPSAAIWTTGYKLSEVPGRLYSMFAGGGAEEVTGEDVNPESAKTLSVVYACIRNLAEDIAKLPLVLYEGNERGVGRMKGKREAIEQPLFKILLTRPNPRMTAFDFWQTIVAWRCGWGNGYAEIERTRRGGAAALWPIHPSRVHIRRPTDGMNQDGRPASVRDEWDWWYEVYPDAGPKYVIERGDMFHLKGLGDGIEGVSVVTYGAMSMGRALAVQSFSSAFFGNGANFGVILQHPKTLSDKARQQLREGFERRHVGARKAFRVFVAEEGMTVSDHPGGIEPQAAQLIETNQFTVVDCCRWFRMPPHKVGHIGTAQGWSTLEATNLDYKTDTLQPHAIAIENEVQLKLIDSENDRQDAGLTVDRLEAGPTNAGPTRSTSFFAKHDFDELLRADRKARFECYQIGKMNGWLTANEIRAAEDMNPLPDGPGNLVTIPSNLAVLGRDGMPMPASAPGTGGGQGSGYAEDPELAEINFKRELVKQWIGDGTISDVMFNITDGRRLLEQVNVPIAPDAAAEPLLPVVAQNGPIVSGEVIKDADGSIIGGDVIEASEPSLAEPGDKGGEDGSGGDSSTENTESTEGDEGAAGDSSSVDSSSSVDKPGIESALRRVERRLTRSAIRAARHPEAMRHFLNTLEEKHLGPVADMIGNEHEARVLLGKVFVELNDRLEAGPTRELLPAAVTAWAGNLKLNHAAALV